MQITIINDCCDQNAKLRQVTRLGSLFQNSSVNCFSVKSEIEASGFLVDAIDSFEGREGIILVNVAPRNGKAKKWENGTPFGFFKYKKTLIISSLDGNVLSLAKKLNLLKEIYIFDIQKVIKSIDKTELNIDEKNRITNSQFRSFDFLPRIAYWLNHNIKLPYKKYDISKIQNIKGKIWFTDNFGNIKTTYLKNEIVVDKNGYSKFKINNNNFKLKLYNHLKDLPDNETGLVVGSSGIGEKRFIEIISQGASATKKLKIICNSKISIS